MKATRNARCRSFLERLSSYIDGDVAGDARRRIEAHLRQCPCCQDMAESLRRTVRVCRNAGHPHLPPEVRARARARIAALMEPVAAQGPGRVVARRRAPRS